MGIDERVGNLERDISAIAKQLATLSDVIISTHTSTGRNTGPASQPKAVSQNPSKDNTTIIRDGRTIQTSEVYPSNRPGHPPSPRMDIVENYFSSKVYGLDDDKRSGITPSQRPNILRPRTEDKGMQMLEPKTAAEMPSSGYPEAKLDKTHAVTIEEYIQRLGPSTRKFIDLILGNELPPTKQDYAKEMNEVVTKIIGDSVTGLTVQRCTKALEEVLQHIDEPALKVALDKALPEFMAYIAEIEAERSASFSAGPKLKEFFEAVEKEHIESRLTQIKVYSSGDVKGVAFAKGALIFDKRSPDKLQFFVLGGTKVNPEAVKYANAFMVATFLPDDVLVLEAGPEHKYSIRYMDHEIDVHGNLIIIFSDGQSMLEDETVPDLTQYMFGVGE